MASSDSEPSRQLGYLPPPPGVTPDFDHPRDAGRVVVLAGLIVCNVLVTIFVSLRGYVKIFINRRILLADWACLVSWVLILVYSATVFTMIHYGLGHYAWEVTVENYSEVLKVSPRIHWFLWALLLLYTPVQTIKIIICVPINSYWDFAVSGRCINQRRVFIVDLSIAVMADLVIIILPIPITWSLNLPLKKKIKIILMLGAGGAATAVTIFRLIRVVQFVGSTDVTADFGVLGLTTCVELTVGLICACLPSVNLLFERHQSARKRSTARNVPRTGRWSPAVDKTSHWWDTVTGRRTADATALTTTSQTPATALSQTAMTEVAPSQQQTCPPSHHRQMTFDVELAMFTGQPVDGASAEPEVKGSDVRINSFEGRREGWLAPRADGTVESRDFNQIMGTRLWSTIWDGCKDDIPRT
ncbi:hypothetical protein BN1708_001944 [Verticillium longisporum]|uniref:Rhodopsin domain-containing protein n=1 Tax=Verticillium longisporum TaxID=100787 RepID=A0A0G4KCY0_VERLO|nr:hypothetical protein BN1708_001944 [Verticillium longisporum]